MSLCGSLQLPAFNYISLWMDASNATVHDSVLCTCLYKCVCGTRAETQLGPDGVIPLWSHLFPQLKHSVIPQIASLMHSTLHGILKANKYTQSYRGRPSFIITFNAALISTITACFQDLCSHKSLPGLVSEKHSSHLSSTSFSRVR